MINIYIGFSPYPPPQNQYPPVGNQSQYPPAGNQSQYPPAGNQSQYPPAGNQSHYPPAGNQSQPYQHDQYNMYQHQQNNPGYSVGQNPNYPPPYSQPGYGPVIQQQPNAYQPPPQAIAGNFFFSKCIYKFN